MDGFTRIEAIPEDDGHQGENMPIHEIPTNISSLSLYLGYLEIIKSPIKVDIPTHIKLNEPFNISIGSKTIKNTPFLDSFSSKNYAKLIKKAIFKFIFIIALFYSKGLN